MKQMQQQITLERRLEKSKIGQGAYFVKTEGP